MDSLGKQLMRFIDEEDLVLWKDNGESTRWNDGAKDKINEFLDKTINKMLEEEGRLDLGKANTNG